MKTKQTELVGIEAGVLRYMLRDDMGPIGRYFYQDFSDEKDLTNMEAYVRSLILTLLKIPGVNFLYFGGDFLTIYHSVLFGQDKIHAEVKSILGGYGQGEISSAKDLQPRIGVSYGIEETTFDVAKILTRKNGEVFFRGGVKYKDTLASRIAFQILFDTDAGQVTIKTRQVIVKHSEDHESIETKVRQILKEELGSN